MFLESYRLLRNFHETDEGSTVDEDSVKARINELLSGDKQVRECIAAILLMQLTAVVEVLPSAYPSGRVGLHAF